MPRKGQGPDRSRALLSVSLNQISSPRRRPLNCLWNRRDLSSLARQIHDGEFMLLA